MDVSPKTGGMARVGTAVAGGQVARGDEWVEEAWGQEWGQKHVTPLFSMGVCATSNGLQQPPPPALAAPTLPTSFGMLPHDINVQRVTHFVPSAQLHVSAASLAGGGGVGGVASGMHFERSLHSGGNHNKHMDDHTNRQSSRYI